LSVNVFSYGGCSERGRLPGPQPTRRCAGQCSQPCRADKPSPRVPSRAKQCDSHKLTHHGSPVSQLRYGSEPAQRPEKLPGENTNLVRQRPLSHGETRLRKRNQASLREMRTRRSVCERLVASRPYVVRRRKQSELRNLQSNFLGKLLTTFVARDDTVTQHDDATRVCRDIGLVRDHDNRLPRARQLFEDAHDFL